ncbi:YqiA/YcfP family alpha/beta fold hydrolase [Geoalkalibacter subterraneus]|uniref:Alpha/beta hydrolase n=1 Tax=Geoalkalibacter subterraneus TaxID=483547 RepID=A0A0B5FDU9_9BACT|nr:alpha/beta fold hydrolase [Geoalkalibacter subterraneus]AJF06337.1 alpha/beta hydrolase [Geoalkalibacter subterraneus]
MQPTIYFAHGKESGPWGSKIQALASVAERQGYRVESPDYSRIADPDVRVERLLSLAAHEAGPLVLVGSSMGGYVSTVASAQLRPAGLFLMAPAFYLPGYEVQEPVPEAKLTALVHGWNDEVVPVENAIRFAGKHRCELHLFHSDHRLMSHLQVITGVFDDFLRRLA